MDASSTTRVTEAPRLTARNWVNLAAFIFNVGVTYGSLTGIFGATNTALSKKYQTLVTPAGWAFSIWGPIFIWEGTFAISQMLPTLRASALVQRVTIWWCAACSFQILWSVVFAQEAIVLAMLCMLGILGSLLVLNWMADVGESITAKEFCLLRGAFSLHLGWIVAASALNANVLADASRAAPATLLTLAIVSLGAVFTTATVFATAINKPDAILCLASAWALLGIYSELGAPANLADPARFNPVAWDATTIVGIRGAALILGLVLVVLAIGAAGFRLFVGCKKHIESQDTASASTTLTQTVAAGNAA
jgi:hypothetical protein